MLPGAVMKTLASGLLLVSGALANPVPNPAFDRPLSSRQITPGGQPCGEHGPNNRRCWMNNWNVDTDYESAYPPAFNNREYDFYITNVTSFQGPDGVTKHALLINNQFPGPNIEANWGDYIVVNVHNQLQDNGTSIHWHGIRQLGESDQDGANGITECPIPPGGSKTYAFHVQQYGSSWYHSHFQSQYGNGIVGTMVVHGPATANYDIDLGPYMITDYYWETADVLQRRAEISGPPNADNILFRGKNINPDNPSQGSFDRVTLTPGKKHRLRLINTSVDNAFTISLVGHTFTVIQIDLVPVEPIVKSQLFMTVGQRYDVIIEANQPVDNYWLKATLSPSGLCGTSRNTNPRSIFHYEGASNGNPTNNGPSITAGCADETGFTPRVSKTPSQSNFNPTDLELELEQPTVDFRGTVFRWEINDVDIRIEWDHPILEYVYEGRSDWPNKANVIEVPTANQWTFWVIQNNFLLPHPIHLHGHDFYLLGTGTGRFSSSMQSQLDWSNPIRRDVAQLPGNGWMVLAFITDNPGAWLMHCHIGWHVSEGFGVQFLERRSEINRVLNLNQMVPNCNAWRAYWPNAAYRPMLDSGL